jgi:Fic family protein
MDVGLIRQLPLGQVVPISGFDQRSGEEYAHWAYLPDPLPTQPDLDLSTATWRTVTRAEAALARLDEASNQIPEPALLRRPSLRREAQSTSALEGTFAPFEEVLEPDVEERETLPVELRENLNYVVTAEEAFAWIAERPITRAFLGQLQLTLVKGTPAEHSDAGGLRDRQVVIGAPGTRVVDARFVPPPPGDQLRAGVDDWLGWIASPPEEYPPIVRAALAHYQFETLHPFSDGNGRIGRLLIVVQLMRDGVLSEPLLVVSPWFEQRRTNYQDELLKLTVTGKWDSWVSFFSEGVAAGAARTRRNIETLLGWRDEAIRTVRRARSSGVPERLASELIGAPVLTAGNVARRHNITHQGAMNALRRLAELGLLEEHSRSNGRRVFRAPAVIQILSE